MIEDLIVLVLLVACSHLVTWTPAPVCSLYIDDSLSLLTSFFSLLFSQGTQGYDGQSGNDGDPGEDVSGLDWELQISANCPVVCIYPKSANFPLSLPFVSSGSYRSPRGRGRAWTVWCQGNEHNGSYLQWHQHSIERYIDGLLYLSPMRKCWTFINV